EPPRPDLHPARKRLARNRSPSRPHRRAGAPAGRGAHRQRGARRERAAVPRAGGCRPGRRRHHRRGIHHRGREPGHVQDLRIPGPADGGQAAHRADAAPAARRAHGRHAALHDDGRAEHPLARRAGARAAPRRHRVPGGDQLRRVLERRAAVLRRLHDRRDGARARPGGAAVPDHAAAGAEPRGHRRHPGFAPGPRAEHEPALRRDLRRARGASRAGALRGDVRVGHAPGRQPRRVPPHHRTAARGLPDGAPRRGAAGGRARAGPLFGAAGERGGRGVRAHLDGARHHRAQAVRCEAQGSQGSGRGRQPGQERVPFAHEPRAAHPHEQHPGVRAAAAAQPPPGRPGAERGAHSQGRPPPAEPDQRGAGDRAHRGQPAAALAGAGARGHPAERGAGPGAPHGRPAPGAAVRPRAAGQRRLRARRPAAAHAGAAEPAFQRHQVQPLGRRGGAPGAPGHGGGREGVPGDRRARHGAGNSRRPAGRAVRRVFAAGGGAFGGGGHRAGTRPFPAPGRGDGRAAARGKRRGRRQHLLGGASRHRKPARAAGPRARRRGTGEHGGAPRPHHPVRGRQPGEPGPGGNHPHGPAGDQPGPRAAGAIGASAGARTPAGPGAAGPSPARRLGRDGASRAARGRAHAPHSRAGDQRRRHHPPDRAAARGGGPRLPDQAAGRGPVPHGRGCRAGRGGV
ncbi:MAG: diguanylate cyclase/phosphodiesterase (GGDEF & EAL domains) with PAS/PAC sensor(s), partial [uncultured Gemmatimonadetes bacterium]